MFNIMGFILLKLLLSNYLYIGRYLLVIIHGHQRYLKWKLTFSNEYNVLIGKYYSTKNNMSCIKVHALIILFIKKKLSIWGLSVIFKTSNCASGHTINNDWQLVFLRLGSKCYWFVNVKYLSD